MQLKLHLWFNFSPSTSQIAKKLNSMTAYSECEFVDNGCLYTFQTREEFGNV